jgi:hypothetical protein
MSRPLVEMLRRASSTAKSLQHHNSPPMGLAEFEAGSLAPSSQGISQLRKGLWKRVQQENLQKLGSSHKSSPTAPAANKSQAPQSEESQPEPTTGLSPGC